MQRYATNPEPVKAAVKCKYAGNPELMKGTSRSRHAMNPKQALAASRSRYLAKWASLQTSCVTQATTEGGAHQVGYIHPSKHKTVTLHTIPATQ